MNEFMEAFGNTVHKLETLVDTPSLLLNQLSEQNNIDARIYFLKLKTMKSNLERMKFVYEDMEKYQVFPPFKKDEKCDKLATDKRETGNMFYNSGKYREALDCYTSSLLVARSDKVAALAYANRSAALSKLDLHKECLIEIDRALENNYPENLKPKLIARKKHSTAQKVTPKESYEPVPEISEFEKNSKIQVAKNCIKITKNQKYGRHVVATRNIQIGEIIAVDTLYAGMINDHIFYVYCHECFELCYNLIPCDKCSKALYCSDNCKDKAFNTYHQYECSILLSLDSIQIDSPKKLALKIVFKARNELDTNFSETDEFYRSDRFKEVVNFLTHDNEREADNLYGRTVIACNLFHLIKKHTTFLKDGPSEDRLMEILLSTVLICGSATVMMNELSPQVGGTGSYEIRGIVTGIYPFFTLFSHSCVPNLSRHYHGSSMVLRAINRIKKGEQCFVCYGPHYAFYPKSLRQNNLLNFHFFMCTCRACEENWPTQDMMFDQAIWAEKFFTMSKLETADVKAAKKELPLLLAKAKKAQRRLSADRDCIFQGLLSYCYDVFGNKRRIQGVTQISALILTGNGTHEKEQLFSLRFWRKRLFKVLKN